MAKIRIGTRKSKLAMIQTELVIAAYKKVWHDFDYEIVPMTTKGDKQLNQPLRTFGGKGAFVTEIEEALKNRVIDLAVHSAKDLPPVIGEGLMIAATLKREDPRDVLVMKRELCEKLAEANFMAVPVGEAWEKQLEFLRGCRLKSVGTGSARRQYQLGSLIGAGSKEIRGNVTTRLSKLETGEYDAVMLAAAGLKRLDLLQEEEYCYFYMEPESFLPAPCQGIIAVESRCDDPRLAEYRQAEDELTAQAFRLERSVMEKAGGSCRDIVGALALPQKESGQMELHTLLNGIYSVETVNSGTLAHKERKVYLVGAGPGAEDLITLRGRRLIGQSDVLIYDALVDESLLQSAPAHCKKIYVGKRAGKHSMKQEDISGLLLSECGEGLTVVRLKGGDPFVFGRGGEEVQALMEAGIAYEPVPGVTSAVAAPELAGIPVTHRGVAGSFTVLTGHTQDNEVTTEEFDTLARLQGTIVVLMGVKHGGRIAEGLIRAGKSADTPIAFIENASLPAQRLVRGNLSETEKIVEAGKVQAPAVLVIGDVAAFPFCHEPEKVAILGTENFVGLVKKESERLLRESEVPPQQTAPPHCSLPVFADFHNLQIIPLAERLPENIPEGGWLLFTSGYGVITFMELCKRERLDLRQLSRLKLAVIGKDTAGFLEKYGLYPDFAAARAEGYAFGKEFAAFLREKQTDMSETDKEKGGKQNQVILLRAKKASAGLPKALAEEGIVFTDFALYDTLAIEEAGCSLVRELERADSKQTGLVFGSRSAAEALLDSAGASPELQRLLQNKRFFCMGNSAGNYLLERGISEGQIFVPEAPSVEALVKLIYSLYAG